MPFWISDISATVMNYQQRAVLAMGAIVVSLMALFPPWLVIYQEGDIKIGPRFAGYHPIWQGGVPTDSQGWFVDSIGPESPIYLSLRLDIARLTIQMVAALIVTGLLYLMLRELSAFAKSKRTSV